MRFLLPTFILFGSLNAFACSDALKPYEFECKSQDRFLLLANDFKSYSINITDLKGFKIPKALGKLSYFSSKNDLLNNSASTLAESNEWQSWNNGQNFIESLNSIYIDLNDIQKLHKTLFATKGFFNRNPDAGKMRIQSPETNPKISFSCADNVLNEELLENLLDFDLKSAEGYPLLSVKNISNCVDGKHKSADLFFYKGASMKVELNRWVVDLSDMLNRYENASAPLELSPYKYLADMRRWFLAIRPFESGNEQVVNALMDYSARRLQLAPIPTGEASSIFLTVDQNRDASLNRINEQLTFFEGCLFETKVKLISSECRPLK